MNGASYSAASFSNIVHPKSMIHLPAGRRVRSLPLTQGLRTSELGRPFGFDGKLSHWRARSPGISNAPRLMSP